MRPPFRRHHLTASLAVTLMLGLHTLTAAQSAAPVLTLGGVTTVSVVEDEPTILSFEAETAGFLTVIVRGASDVDLMINVTDDLGQLVPDGRADRDMGGNMGAEQLTVTLAHPADYQVRVMSRYGRTDVRLAATWVSFPDIETPPDPDGRPTAANALETGSRLEDSLDQSSGDHWDWFAIESPPDSVVTVLTDAPEGDLVLEVFDKSDFSQPADRSDQDMNGVSGNESLTIRNPTGGTIYVRVSSLGMSSSAIPYTIRAGVM